VIKKSSDLYHRFRRYNVNIDLNDKILLIIRSGGIGDLLFLTPMAREVKKRYPDSKIFLVCMEQYHEMFKGLPFYDAVFPIPVAFSVIQKEVRYPMTDSNSYCFSMESLIEEDKRAKEQNVYELLAEEFGFLDVDLAPQVYLNENKLKEIKDLFFKEPKDFNKLNIGYQFTASSAIRTVKPQYTLGFLNIWEVPDTRIFLIDSKHKKDFIKYYLKRVDNPLINEGRLEIIDVSSYGLDYAQLVALVSLLDFVIGPDSSIMHLAECFGKPKLGLFAAFHSELRLKNYKNTVALDVFTDCKYIVSKKYSSCFIHGDVCPKAKDLKRYFAPCMDFLTPYNVVGATYAFLQDLKLIEISMDSKYKFSVKKKLDL